jgi:hypothetical protein
MEVKTEVECAWIVAADSATEVRGAWGGKRGNGQEITNYELQISNVEIECL